MTFSRFEVSKLLRDMKNSSSTAQWENISITSMEVDFWGVKNSGCENSHATEVIC
jgi:hypothetical protein